MKNRNKLTLVLAAMVVSLQVNGPAGAAAPTLEQLAKIESHIISSNFAALAAMLSEFPELVDPSTAFGQELGAFFAAYSANPGFAFSPTTLTAMQAALSSVPSAAAPSASAIGRTSSLY